MKIKALLLLFTFLLNSAVGLRCALQKEDDCCEEVAEHQAKLIQQDQPSLTVVVQVDPCCQDAVNNFASLAKLVPQPVKVSVSVDAVLVQSPYFYTSISIPVVQTVHRSLIDERQRPPTPDIRIIIQSFQV
ncbi:hypothetical protein [Mucilaginibacter sp. L3T2-6]|uniref:hypothetical protein n=1 Tax=Mucilaginibacter sp. L3T2-6 TaxID=3062491 RepID=UPI00267602FA|nr:hypothetical protein [Mucilaginibacter sp. L3T2-6]MDO3643460.1 hypothetical protein [Mucilaginibacter sp. L3T2-6]MDV6215911.1 hypothetical protein [Mucilaginibacter sp. L3T2-6]